MKKIYTPNDEVELAVIRSLLDSADIPYKIVNQYFGSLYIGPAMGSLNSKPVMVPEEYFEEARDVLSNYLSESEVENEINNSGSVPTGENGILDDLEDIVRKIFGKLF